MRILFYLAIMICAAVLLLFVSNATAVSLLTGVIAAPVVALIDYFLINRSSINILFASVRHRKTLVRVSVSYMIRIKSRGEYLLIQGSRYPDQFQPIGGVYKYNPSARDKFTRWGIQSDNLLPIDETSNDDLRIRVPGRHLRAFVAWLKTGENREIGAIREFHEELISTQIASGLSLSDLRFDYIKQHIHPIRYSDYAQSYELLIADIFEFEPRGGIEVFRQNLSKTASDQDIIWVDRDRITRRGAEPGKPHTVKIAQTAEWIL
ncbi:hypothetical protein M8542_01815 [Amycolatopsis sp. OK19-0408]|uniref:CD-NTase-associated protein 16 NUDIX domain-containing protein n=1 Tax=Amycolatopsis iheyensis TaxID=2945988 RepID=A0A9X2SI77_9PSEU|nr:hypothetical protein [Amycolatopsis iheyensis]MCR6481541.1 hypothetical protein [Amycolatopsis iheyensis]